MQSTTPPTSISESGSATTTRTSTHSACSRRGVPPTLPRHPLRRPPPFLPLRRHHLHRSRRSRLPRLRRLPRPHRLLCRLPSLLRRRSPPRPHRWPRPPAAPRPLRPVRASASRRPLSAERVCGAGRPSAERRLVLPSTAGRARSRCRPRAPLVERRSAALPCLRRRASLERTDLALQGLSVRGRRNCRLAMEPLRLRRAVRFAWHSSTPTEWHCLRAGSMPVRTAVWRLSVRRSNAGSRGRCSS
jgi:hypothetical protein